MDHGDENSSGNSRVHTEPLQELKKWTCVLPSSSTEIQRHAVGEWELVKLLFSDFRCLLYKTKDKAMFSVHFLASLVSFMKYEPCIKVLEVKEDLGFLGSKVKGEVEISSRI